MTILIDSNLYTKESFGASFDFLLSHGLVELKEYLISYKVVFVGEVITPYGHFIALPKNFENTSLSNVEMLRSILKEFKNLKKRGKTLIKNKSFQIGTEIHSDFFYWKKLYSFFLDFITYEFYYPQKRNYKHSRTKTQGILDPRLTEMNRERLGYGITYHVKNYTNNYFRNVFYSTLKLLALEFASELEEKKIKDLELFLLSKNIQFEVIEVDESAFMNHVKTLQTNPIHQIIVKTLKNYFLHTKIREKNTINVFYTKEFEYFFEYLLQKVLHHNNDDKNISWANPNFKTLHPDIITRSFIGDAKYYRIKDFSANPFEKELYAYNVANHNSQPNLVFIPSEETKHLKTLLHYPYKLEVVTVDLGKLLQDYRKKTQFTLDFVGSVLVNKVL